MVTREQIETALADDNDTAFTTKDVDHYVIAITLLRERIPYIECKSIIRGAGYETLYLCDVNVAIKHLTEQDLVVLADCNCFIDDDCECIALFV